SRGAWALRSALGFAFAALVRFTVWGLLPLLVVVTLLARARGARGLARRGALVWATLLACVPVALVALQLGYLGKTSFAPLGSRAWHSNVLGAAAKAAPWLRV